jgi:hypothetical protein
MPQLEAWLAAVPLCPLSPKFDGLCAAPVSAAGRVRTIFEPAAVGFVHQESEGVARRINCFSIWPCRWAFEEHASIGAAQIESVSQELGVAAS